MKSTKTIPVKTSNLLVYSVLLFGGLFFLYYPQLQNYSVTPKWVYLSLFALGISFFRFKDSLNWSLGLWIWLGFVVVYLLGCFGSNNFWDSVVRSTPLILTPVLVLLLAREEKDGSKFFSKIALVSVMFIAPILLYTIFEVISLALKGEFTHLSTYSFRFTFGHRNHFAEIIALLVPIAAAGLHFAEIKWKKYVMVAGIVLLYITGTLLLNRAVLLVLYGIYPIGLMIILLFKAKESVRKFGFWGLGFFVFVGVVLVASPIRKQIPVVKNLLETGHGSGSERIQIWKNSFGIWQESPLVGKGSGDWKIEILRTPLQNSQAAESTVFYQRAHNDFIQILVENGMVGALLFVAFFAVGIFLLLKSTIDKTLKIILIAGVLAYILISNFSFPLERVELLLLLFLFMAPTFQTISNKNGGKLLKTGMFAILFFVFLFSMKWLQMEKNYFLFKFENDVYALDEIDKTQYTIDPTCTPLMWHVGNDYYNKADYEKALESFQKAEKYNPFHAHLLNNIGSTYYALKDLEKAEAYYQKALAVNPEFIETLMNYSSFQFNSKNVNGALEHILSIPPHKEPANYKMYMVAIAKAKYQSMMDLYDEPKFEAFLQRTKNNDDFLYEVSKKARVSLRSYEMELREEMKKEK